MSPNWQKPRIRKKSPRNAGEWLRHCKGPVRGILEQSQALLLLQKQLAKILPEPLISHVQVIHIRHDQLVLAADSAVWASQLRHRRSMILRHMTQPGQPALQRLEVKISPLYAPPLIRTLNRQLPAQAGQHLEMTARTVDDPELSAALRRLSRHASAKAETDTNR